MLDGVLFLFDLHVRDVELVYHRSTGRKTRRGLRAVQ